MNLPAAFGGGDVTIDSFVLVDDLIKSGILVDVRPPPLAVLVNQNALVRGAAVDAGVLFGFADFAQLVEGMVAVTVHEFVCLCVSDIQIYI